jgi:hypothetical protein
MNDGPYGCTLIACGGLNLTAMITSELSLRNRPDTSSDAVTVAVAHYSQCAKLSEDWYVQDTWWPIRVNVQYVREQTENM